MLLDDCYISFLNLFHRTDRLAHINNELAKAGIKAERTLGRTPHHYDLTDPKLQVMKNRTPGAIGCHYGQVKIMRRAMVREKHAFVMEDDCVFCSDFQERMKIVDEFLKDKDWHIFWLGGTWHPSSQTWWHKEGHSPDLPQCDCTLGKDAEPTEDKRFVRTYGAFSTHCYIVNNRFIEPLLEFLESHVHLSMGIDWLMILLQPKINTYAFVPGCVKQMDSQSDIGNGITYFSGFNMLGEHWYQDKMSDFNYDNFVV
jgi:GR25 family glycosyltransferase involved in LPS biosynthesis